LVTAVSAGTTTISVTVDGAGPATFVLTVAPPSVATVGISAPDSAIAAGTFLQATVVARDASNNPLPLTGRTILWASSATGVASISGTGLISATSQGSTTISVTVDGVGPAAFTLVVAPASVAAVSVTATDSSITTGQTTQATVVARDAANNVLSLSGRSVVWSSGANGIASVDATGLVSAVSAGTAIISVTVDGIGPASFSLSVAPPSVATVSIAAPDSNVTAGDALQASVVARDASGAVLPLTGRTIVWTSSATAIASITNAGLITTLTPGSTTIGVTVDGVGPATFSLTVAAPAVASVSVSANDSSLTIGTTTQATVVARDASNNVLSLGGRAVAWSSSATSIATITSSGVITGVAAGTTTIGVTVDGIGPATFTLDVSAAPVASVSISATDSSLTIGATAQTTVVARDAANNVLSLAGHTVAWSSSATGIATISTSGTISAVAAGSTTIGVTVDGIGPATFTLTVAPPAVASVTIAAPDSSVVVGSATQAVVEARDAANNVLSLPGRTVVWSSSIPSVASVSPAGLMTALSAGTTTISVTVDGVGPASLTLTVASAAVATVSVSAPDSSLNVGDAVQATVVARDGAGNTLSLTGRTIVWSSSAGGVASVSSTGQVGALTVGNATISVTVDGVGPASLPVSVSAIPVATVSVTTTDSSLSVGDATQGTVVARDANGAILALAGRTVNWSSSATGIATVTSVGLVSAVGPGSSTIGVTVDGVGPATIQVTVAAVPVASVTVAAPDSSLVIGDVVTAVAEARDAGGNLLSLTGRTVAWTSSASGIATVSSTGVITAIVAGASNIGVTVDGIGPASFPLTVSNIPVASVTVSATDSSVAVGDPPVQASVQARDGSGNLLALTGRTVAWSSANTLVATVSSSGVVTAIGVGSTTVRVTVDGVGPASFTFTVIQVPVDHVDVAPTTANLQVGETLSASATPRDAAGNALTNRAISWSVDNPKASIAPTSGASTTLSALDSGTVVLSALSEGKTGTATITISLVPVDTVESIPPRAAPGVTLQAGAGTNSREMFRARSLTAGNLVGRAFAVSSSAPSLATVAVVGSPLTDTAGKGEFVVTLTAAAVAGDAVDVSVTIEGKVTVWKVVVQ
ncbi:MAG: Ig-like domain-containing protein, partial [Gemmatimonadota bacterium]